MGLCFGITRSRPWALCRALAWLPQRGDGNDEIPGGRRKTRTHTHKLSSNRYPFHALKRRLPAQPIGSALQSWAGAAAALVPRPEAEVGHSKWGPERLRQLPTNWCTDGQPERDTLPPPPPHRHPQAGPAPALAAPPPPPPELWRRSPA